MPYIIRGFIYYQGEKDVRLATKYGALLQNLIAQRRSLWNEEYLFFLFVQLPMYIEHSAMDDRQWALLRDQQYKVHKKIVNTGLAVLIDCGEYDNIHPADKQIVGLRLALQALRRCYNYEVEADSPVYAVHRIIDNKVYISFDNTNSGLIVRGHNNRF